MELKTSYGTYKGVFLQVGKYRTDDSIAIMAENQQEGAIATITVCLCDRSLEENEAYVDTNNCPWALNFIESNKLGKQTGRTRRSGFCTYPAVKFNIEQLRLYGLEEQQNAESVLHN